MSMQPLRDNVAIAIDGGGIKGLVVSRALAKLERELGGKPLIEHPSIKILAGTSTGSLISMGLAVGMSADQIAQIYSDFGQDVFPPLSPPWFPEFLRKLDEMARMLLTRSLYPSKNVIKFLRKAVGDQTQNPDMTLGELNQRLGPGKAVIFTTVDITARRTRFIKSYQEKWAHWKVWEAALASSVAPVALPVYKRKENGVVTYYTDGGVGSFGNPAYVATQEAIVFQGIAPKDVSMLSFGTGWISPANFELAQGQPSRWMGLDWALNAPNVITGDAIRTQSIDIIDDYGSQGLDFRRFQFPLEKDINSDAFADSATYDFMKKLGDELGDNILNNRYAPNQDPQYDPEGLWDALERYRTAQA